MKTLLLALSKKPTLTDKTANIKTKEDNMLQSHNEKYNECMDLLEQYRMKKDYKSYYRIHRELERMMEHVEFHFIDKNNVEQEVLCFSSYNEMIETLINKMKES